MTHQDKQVAKMMQSLQPTFEYMKSSGLSLIVQDCGKEAVVLVSGSKEAKQLLAAVRRWKERQETE